MYLRRVTINLFKYGLLIQTFTGQMCQSFVTRIT